MMTSRQSHLASTSHASLRAWGRGALLLLSLAAIAPLAAQTKSDHPKPAYITPAARTTSVAFGTGPKAVTSAVRGVVVGAIGEEAGTPATTLGTINRAVFLDDTTVAIIDWTEANVRLFTITGRHLQTVGRKGQGPGEFRAPQTVAIAPSGDLFIADVRRTIEIFRRGPEGWEYRTTWKLPFGVRDMCFVGDRLFVNAAVLGKPEMLHEIDDAGSVVRSFGSVYRSPNQLVDHDVANGNIACDPERQLVHFIAGSVIGDVRAYRTTGALVWRVQVTDFRNNIITDTPDGLRVSGSPGGAHSPTSLTLEDQGGLVAVWTLIRPEEMKARIGPQESHLVRIDPTSGTATSLGMVPANVRDVRGSLRLESSEDPYPRVEVRRVARTAR